MLRIVVCCTGVEKRIALQHCIALYEPVWNPLATQQCRKLKCSLFQKGNSSLSMETCCLALQVNCHILVQLRFFSRRLSKNTTCSPELSRFQVQLEVWINPAQVQIWNEHELWVPWLEFSCWREKAQQIWAAHHSSGNPHHLFFWLPKTTNDWKWVHQCGYMDREWLERSYIIRVVLGQHECVLVLTVITMDAQTFLQWLVVRVVRVVSRCRGSQGVRLLCVGVKLLLSDSPWPHRPQTCLSLLLDQAKAPKNLWPWR